MTYQSKGHVRELQQQILTSRARNSSWRLAPGHLDERAKGNIILISQTLADVHLAECVQRCKPEADIGAVWIDAVVEMPRHRPCFDPEAFNPDEVNAQLCGS